MNNQDLNFVPGKSHYAASYVMGGRLFSYAHQINAVLEYQPHNVIEIGPGPGVVTAALRALEVSVVTVDVQSELSPDVVASVTHLPFEDNSFDVAMCCQVLEHLPFEQFSKACEELCRVTRHAVVISLPDRRKHYWIQFKLPRLHKRLQTSITKRIGKQEQLRAYERSGHYWEIGFPNYSFKTVLSSIESHGRKVKKHWHVPELPWHHFFEITP
jgi:ubiquinone/menaquinone biosynthesis C-methylase UbiE